jgi:transcriptional regulator with XRE-family HTH domain
MIVRKLRLEKRLSQEQLAHMAGISTRTLQRIERGANTSPETLNCIASVLETDFENLLKEQEMPTDKPESPKLSADEKEAMEYVHDLQAFYIHLFVFAAVITGLMIINLFFTPEYFWVLWAAFGWGIGLLSHGLSVFEVFNLFGDDWEKRQVEKRMRRQQFKQ